MKFFYSALILILVSCADDTLDADFISFGESNQSIEDYKRVIFIPQMGCIGCVKEAFDKLSDHYKYEITLFVITAVSDKKNAEIEIMDIYQKDKAQNIFIDGTNITQSHIKLGIYPVSYDVEKGLLINRKESANITQLLDIIRL